MADAVVSGTNLVKTFSFRASTFGRNEPIRAVDDVSLEVFSGETLGLVGESGSGKTTTGRLLLGIEEPDSGVVMFGGRDISAMDSKSRKIFRRSAQLIFQDPFASLPPHMRVGAIVAEPLKINRSTSTAEETREAVRQALESVALVPVEEYEGKRPAELSGGQRQRVAIARVLALRPKFIVADEAVSMLDVSVRVGVLNVLRNLRKTYNLSMVLITHDLGVAAYSCDRLAVMKSGKIVEAGKTSEVVRSPKEGYTRALLAALPSLRSRTETVT